MRKLNTCITCGTERNPKAKIGQCQNCRTKSQRDQRTIEEKAYLVDHGYEVLSDEPTLCKHGKPNYTVKLKSCGHIFSSRFQNIQKQISLRGKSPCNTCGGKERMAKALDGYIEKYGREYNLEEFEAYSKIVRKQSEKTYRLHKNTINPLDLKRGKTDYHLDHIVPIVECFKRNIPIQIAASLDNLQILSYHDNLSKNTNFNENHPILV